MWEYRSSLAVFYMLNIRRVDLMSSIVMALKRYKLKTVDPHKGGCPGGNPYKHIPMC